MGFFRTVWENMRSFMLKDDVEVSVNQEGFFGNVRDNIKSFLFTENDARKSISKEWRRFGSSLFIGGLIIFVLLVLLVVYSMISDVYVSRHEAEMMAVQTMKLELNRQIDQSSFGAFAVAFIGDPYVYRSERLSYNSWNVYVSFQGYDGLPERVVVYSYGAYIVSENKWYR